MPSHAAFIDYDLSTSNRVMAAWLNGVNEAVYDDTANVLRYCEDAGVTPSTADCSDEIEAAIAASGAVVFPAGDYYLDTQVVATLARDTVLIALGPVRIFWGSASAGAGLMLLTTAGFNFTMQGPFEFDCNNLARDGLRLQDTTVGGGQVSITGLYVHDAFSSLVGTGANGLLVVGGYNHASFQRVKILNVSRAAGVGVPGSQGSIGIGVAQSGATYTVMTEVYDCQIVGVTSEEADGDAANVDCDGLAVTGPSGASFSNEQPSTALVVRGCRFEDNRGRHVKAQSGWVDVNGGNYIRDTLKTITNGSDIDIQYGQGSVRGTRHFYDQLAGGGTPFGSSFATISSSCSTDTTVAGALIVDDVIVNNNYPVGSGDQPYFITLAVGASSTWRALSVENCKLMGSGRVGTFLLANGSGDFAGGQASICNNYMARLTASLVEFTMAVTTLSAQIGNNASAEGTLRALVTVPAGGGPLVTGGGGNVGFTQILAGALSGLTVIGETSRASRYAPAATRDAGGFAIQAMELADDATGTFTITNYQAGSGGYFITANFGRTTFGCFSNDGTNIDLFAGASTGIAYGDSANPDTDTKLNVWYDAGTIKVKNRLGSTRIVTLFSFG